MVRRILKFTLTTAAVQTIELPSGHAEILSVQFQGPNLRLWVLADSKAPKQWYRFYVVATGDEIPPPPLRYVNTVQHPGGFLVFHIFQGTNMEKYNASGKEERADQNVQEGSNVDNHA